MDYCSNDMAKVVNEQSIFNLFFFAFGKFQV